MREVVGQCELGHCPSEKRLGKQAHVLERRTQEEIWLQQDHSEHAPAMYLPFRTSRVEAGPKFRREEPYGEPLRSEKVQFAIHEVFQAFLHRRNDAYSHIWDYV